MFVAGFWDAEYVSISLSCAVFMQVVMYFQLYRHDFLTMKAVVRVASSNHPSCLLNQLPLEGFCRVVGAFPSRSGCRTHPHPMLGYSTSSTLP